MKLTVEREKLNKGLSIVAKIISNRPSLPILSNILMVSEEGGLRLTSTDLELGISYWLPASIEQEGSFTVPARIIADFVANNTDSKLSLEVLENSQLVIKSEKFKARVSGLAATEYPSIPEVSDEALEISLNNQAFIQAIRQVVPACAIDDVRPALAGVFFRFLENRVTFVATDSFRLAEKKIQLDLAVPNKEMIVPVRSVQEIIRLGLLFPEDSQIILFVSESQLKIKIGQTQIISRLIEATFPAYEKIIPEEKAIEMKVSANELQTALKATRIFAATGSNNIKISFADSLVTLSSLNSERGQSETQVNADLTYFSETRQASIAYNARYLADSISACEASEILIQVTGEKKPTIIRGVDALDYLHLVMPVDIKE